jgi:hypothetical protein
MISVWDRGSSVGVVTSVKCGRSKIWGFLQQVAEIVLLFKEFFPTQELTQSSVQWMLRVKWTGSWAETSVLLKPTVRMPGGIPPTPLPPLTPPHISRPGVLLL